ncbi:hypothetical protein AMAG_11312 [Allomyces macrogynus ATCC 38327]|uniref:Uncharacterized protein n=1 Tax=Allomyces macrogynus (strain ATCC 38327) TaxID=578462 RepID=A0A0L0SWU3_ALLM3|nr:hypothetical protein AMAG_11312 [Allomyces macrogynus ATCC 38327]|eukprot:KNE66829.1 hypothetical protein AMAG_11312 [Allomyces macrogynus ATCC 38327]
MPLLQYLRVDILSGAGAGATPLACHADMDRILASAENAAGSPLQYFGILAAPNCITACSCFLQNNSPVHAYRARIWLGSNPWATHHLRPGGACTVPGLLAAVQAGKGAMKVEWHQARFLSGQDRGPVPVKRRVVGTKVTDQPNVPYDVGGMLWELLEATPSTVFEFDCSALFPHGSPLVPSMSCSAIQQPPRSTTTHMSQSSTNLPIATTGMTTRPRAAAASSTPPPSESTWGADFLRPSNVVFPPHAAAPSSQPAREVIELLDSDDDPMDVDDDDEPIIFTPIPPPPAPPLRAPLHPTRTAAPAAPSRTTMTPPLATSIRLGTARAAAMQRAKPEVIEIDLDSD